MPPKLDIITAARLLKLRVILSGQGGFRLQPNKNAFSALCVLPGREPSVRLSRGFGGKQIAQMFFPDGNPQSEVIDLRTAAGFTLLFQSCDCNIWDGGQPEKITPTEIRRLVNWAVVCPEPAIQAAVAVLWADGEGVDWRRTDADWTPSPQVWNFIRICSRAEDDRVRMPADALKAVLRRDASSSPFDATEAKRDTRSWVLHWVSDSWRWHQEEIRTVSGVWVRLKTRAAIAADAASLGRRAEEFLDGAMPFRLTPRQNGGRLSAPATRRGDAASGVQDDGTAATVETWSLRRDAGFVLGMACIAHGEVILCGRDGRDMQALSAYLTDVATLRRARLPREQAEGT